MPAFFFDASALAKSYIREVGSNWVRGILAPASANDIHVLRIAEVEVTSAIARRLGLLILMAGLGRFRPFMIVALSCGVISLLTSERGLQDRLAGTWLVPRC